jgi:hypothetical protein
MRARDGQFENVRYLVRVLAGQELEEGAYLSRGGLEQRHHLPGPLDRTLPMIRRIDGEPIDAGGQPPGHGGLANPPGAGVIGEPTVDDPENPFRPADLVWEGAHAATSSGARAFSSEKSRTWSDRSVRRTTAARAGTGEMFRIRW